jgi:uncharacterized membrane protein YkoI
MKLDNNMIEHRLKRAVEANTPNVLPDILQSIENIKGGTEMNMENNNQTRPIAFDNSRKERRTSSKWIKWAAGAAAAFVVAFTGFFASSQLTPQAIVGFDVNPSVELKVNRSEKILDVVPLNAEGEEIIGDMDLKRVDLDVGVNAIIGSMVKNGYISEAKNSILISVNSKNSEKGAQLQKHLTEEVNSLLNSYNLDGAILSQTLSDDDRIAELADKYDISLGKAALIDLIVNNNERYTHDDLAKLSINDIYLLLHSKQNKPENVDFSGEASSKEYIGAARAKEIAFEHAKVNEADVRNLEVEMDYDDGRMIYEVEFDAGNKEYEYDIDAVTGAIIEYDIDDDYDDDDDDNGGSNAGNNQKMLSREEAKNIAFRHAGVSAANVRDLDIELDDDDGRKIYEIDFEVGNKEYEFDIDAYTGKILKYETDDDDVSKRPSNNTPSKPASSSQSLIGAEKAKSIAFNHAGVSAANVRDLDVELDSDDGRRIYEVDFEVGSKDYEYDIDAYTGKIIKYEIDEDDDDDKRPSSGGSSQKEPTKPGNTQTVIGIEKAKSIAFNHAGVAAADVRDLDVELDEDDGRKIYEIDFEVGDREYEYDIDAYTGKILDWEWDD